MLKATNILVQTKVNLGNWSPKTINANGGKKQINTANKKEEKNLFFTPSANQDLFEIFLACKILEKAYSIMFDVYLQMKTKRIKIKNPIKNFVLADNMFQ